MDIRHEATDRFGRTLVFVQFDESVIIVSPDTPVTANYSRVEWDAIVSAMA